MLISLLEAIEATLIVFGKEDDVTAPSMIGYSVQQIRKQTQLSS